MNNKIFLLLLILTTSVFGSIPVDKKPQQKDKNKDTKAAKAKSERSEAKAEQLEIKPAKIKDVRDQEKVIATTRIDTSKLKLKNALTQLDSLDLSKAKLKVLKKNAHASYYHNKFNGRRTASGRKFDNNGYTAAHKKLPFGTKVKVTNEANGKFVIVEITDRGPFSKTREIDLTRKAFMDLANNKNSGSMIVTIEVIEQPK